MNERVCVFICVYNNNKNSNKDFVWRLKARKSLGAAASIKQMCFSSFLNLSWSSTTCSTAGKQFQTRGLVTANDLSPSLVRTLRRQLNVVGECHR